ncbi:hypothetical protein GC1_07025 [Leisingera sp. ANG1]|nr:hypothetical protein RA21_08900 [Leisingera sp. ANG-DT]KIC23599.1 hypothetical protein RA23_13770 [Leisingera sp. ANG-S3]KIC32249.1 hypothetical protein RA25_12485 [Leisingera sp. ANG-S5]KIC52170.1 hypothetical protein RA22_16850 [Leisingera sp. ANG-S]KID09728.1 hypothetical protein GC1_07025 [Leisingera sp. ANG1]
MWIVRLERFLFLQFLQKISKPVGHRLTCDLIKGSLKVLINFAVGLFVARPGVLWSFHAIQQFSAQLLELNALRRVWFHIYCKKRDYAK